MRRELRIVLGAAVLSLALLPGASGPTLADQIAGTPDNDILPGTPRRDTTRGLAGHDTITPGKAADRAFGDEGADSFHWSNGDGPDPAEFESDSLAIANAGRRLCLHLDALGTGPETVTRDELQVIGLKRIERIAIGGTGGRDRLVRVSSFQILVLALVLPGKRPRDMARLTSRSVVPA
jgi:Ca2+-binding RTX toxin-like protein